MEFDKEMKRMALWEEKEQTRTKELATMTELVKRTQVTKVENIGSSSAPISVSIADLPKFDGSRVQDLLTFMDKFEQLEVLEMEFSR